MDPYAISSPQEFEVSSVRSWKIFTCDSMDIQIYSVYLYMHAVMRKSLPHFIDETSDSCDLV